MNSNVAQNTSHHHGGEPDLDTYRDMSVGQILQRTREHYGQTLPQVESNLRIRASQLQALEQEDVSQLPGRVYAIGFVRAYAEYLGLDGDKMVHLFKAQTVGKRSKPELQFPVTVNESKAPNLPILFSCLIAVVALIAYISMFHAPVRYEETIPPVPQILIEKRESLLKPSLLAPDESNLLAPIVEKPAQLELVATSDSWVEIKNSEGALVMRKVLKPGDKYKVPEDSDLTLSTGNAGGLTIFIDGKKIKTLGGNAEVQRNVELSSLSLFPTINF